MSYVIIMGAGAAPGVPSLCKGWGDCDPNNKYNVRHRSGTYYDFNGTEIIIDTSPDLRSQLLDYNIRKLDAVLYTHAHADHLHGIDDLREVNRIGCCNINFYTTKLVLDEIKERFGYLLSNPDEVKNVIKCASLVANEVECGKAFYVNDVKIVPVELGGHNAQSFGYVFNDGEIVHIADFKYLPENTLNYLKSLKIKTMIAPLTTPKGETYHVSLDELMEYIKSIAPEKVVLNHMASECDYNKINEITPDNVVPAFEGMKIEL